MQFVTVSPMCWSTRVHDIHHVCVDSYVDGSIESGNDGSNRFRRVEECVNRNANASIIESCIAKFL